MQSESTQSTKNTSLIDEIYDEILLKEAEAKNKKDKDDIKIDFDIIDINTDGLFIGYSNFNVIESNM